MKGNHVAAALLLACVQIIDHGQSLNNVCKTFQDYYEDMEHNPNCYFNPDVYLSVPEIVQRHGYPIETYTVTTKDGYILTVFRIPHGKGPSTEPTPPVFVQHGISLSSVAFADKNYSLAFVLADNGFDVWLGNFRGSQYSNKHRTMNTADLKYWDFTFHENGVYDLPAQLELVANVTRQKVFYIGYSMGTTAYFVFNAEHPNLAKEKIRLAISLAPVGFLGQSNTPLKYIASFWDLVAPFIFRATDGAFGERTPQFLAEWERLCLPYPFKMNLCLLPKQLTFGIDYPQEDPETLPVVTMQDTDAVAIKTATHFMQLLNNGRFQQFDYRKRNKEVYGTSTPPQYDLSKVNVPNYFIRADNDLFATRKNSERTFSAIPRTYRFCKIYVVKNQMFSHLDFFMARDVKELVYDHIVEVLKYNGKKCP